MYRISLSSNSLISLCSINLATEQAHHDAELARQRGKELMQRKRVVRAKEEEAKQLAEQFKQC